MRVERDITTAREMLELLDEWFSESSNHSDHPCQHENERARLWDVLTALRGPDTDNLDVKHTSTAVIRTAAFPNTEAKASFVVQATFADRRDSLGPMKDWYHEGSNYSLPDWIADGDATNAVLAGYTSHFGGHILRAAKVLGLLDENHEPVKK